jgi:fatty acid desaturase
MSSRTDTSWTIPLVIAASAFLTPLLMRALSRAFPPRRPQSEDYQLLRSRYNAIELWSQLFALIGGVAAVCFVIALHPGNTPWLVGVIFGWLVLVPLLLVAVCTLPRGVSRWHEFWQFYEMRYQISLRLLAPVYILVGSLGVVSTAVLMSRQ